MRAGINARLLYEPNLRGWNRYTVNLLIHLAELDVFLSLYTDRPVHPGHLARLPEGSYTVTAAPGMSYFNWEQRWLPRQCARDRLDVLHTPFHFGLPWSSPCATLMTLHDAIGTVLPDGGRRWTDRLAPRSLQSAFHHRVALRRASRILTVSEYSRQDILRHMGVAKDRVTTVYNGIDERFLAPVGEAAIRSVRERYGLPPDYVFYVGGWEGRKNISFLVRAVAAAQLPQAGLVLAGGGDAEKPSLAALAESLGIGSSTRLLGRVPDEDLPALYAGAFCFVYPSSYEGFGLQLCEAMAAGIPVLAANRTSLPEILGGGGLLFELDDPAQLASLLRQVALDPDFRSRLAEAARRRARDFSWRKTAEQTLAAYHSAAARRMGRECPDGEVAAL